MNNLADCFLWGIDQLWQFGTAFLQSKVRLQAPAIAFRIPL
nr:MAG TPA: hypothetical protein [Caudoviricetes sp.]